MRFFRFLKHASHPLSGIPLGLAALGAVAFNGVACNGVTPIQVRQASPLDVVVLDTMGNPIANVNVSYKKLNFKINTPSTTPPTPYTLPGDFEEASTMQTTDGNGMTEFFFPRHGNPTTADVVVADTDWGHMYSFVFTPQLTVDMVTTVFYEMIAYSTLSPTALDMTQMQTLQNMAYNTINTAIKNYWINPNAPMKSLHRSYQNCLASDSAFMHALGGAALSAKSPQNILLQVPYQNFNTHPSLVNSSPSQQAPLLIETNTLQFQVSGNDKDKDTLFYNWVITPNDPGGNASNLGQPGSQLMQADVLGNSTSTYKYASSYGMLPWYQSMTTVYLSSVISDGGLVTLKTWNVQLTLKERLPVFTTKPTLTATEEQLWTYTPASMSPDNAPIVMQLTAPYPNGMDMCVPSGYYMANPPPNHPTFATPPTWSWQVAGTPCTTPYLVTWTPDNCESGPNLSPQAVTISAVDATGTGTIQSFLVTVNDVNTAPVYSSTPGSLTITGPTPWAYAPVIVDPQLTLNTTGAHNCADVLKFTFVTAPSGATINATTGAIAWTPTGTQVGANPFSIQVDDNHGGITTQNWSVQVNDMNDIPQISAAACPAVAHEAGMMQGMAPFFYNYLCGISVTQWTVNSKFTLSIAGAPAGINQWPLAGFWDVMANIKGFTWTVTDAVTIPRPAVASWPITIQVCNDGEGGKFPSACGTYNYTLTAPKEDLKPQFASSPPVTVMGGCLQADCAVIGNSFYSYTAQITDGNVNPPDTFSYSSTQPVPAGQYAMTTTPGSTTAPTGSVSVQWQVNNSTDLGSHVISLTATSGLVANGGPQSATQNWSVFVQETNRVPSFSAIPPQTGQDGTPYTYNFKSACSTNATTSPNKNLTFALAPGYPTGMTIDSKTGIVNWTPTAGQALGPQPINYTVKCLSKLGTPPTSTSVTVPVTLTFVPLAPVWTAVPPQVIGVRQNYNLMVMASDPDGSSVSLSVVSGLPVGASFVPSGASGTLSWSPQLTDVGTYTLKLRATSTNTLFTDISISLQVVNSPVVLSHPVVVAKATYPYHYELHCLDPAGGGLTFAVANTSPGGVSVTPLSGSTTSAMVTWNPSAAAVGDQVVTVNITDVNNAMTAHTWHINVGSGINTDPAINSVTPSTTPVVLTEALTTNFSVSASDPDGDTLHYAYYWDNVWVSDGATTYSYAPTSIESGDHTLTVAITDGCGNDITQAVPSHVRDSIPVLNKTFTLGGGNLTNMLTNTKSGEIYVASGGGTPSITIFSEATFSSGATSNALIPFAPQRMSLKNNFPVPTDYVLYFAQNGDLLSGSTTFAEIDSTGVVNSCGTGPCYGPTFLQGFLASAGTQTAYVPATLTAYYVKSSAPRYIGRFVNGVAGADIDLGVGAIANSLVFDATSNQVYVSTGGTNVINVINPATNLVSTSVAGVGANPSVMALNSAGGKVYVYSATSGSITEIATATNTVSTTKSGFPTSGAFGASPHNLMVENTDDDVIYLAIPDLHKLVVYDAQNSTIQSLSLPAGPDELSFDLTTHLLFGAQFSSNVLFSTH